MIPRVLASSNPGLKLANAFGVIATSSNSRPRLLNKHLSRDGFTRRRTNRVAVFGWLVIGLFALSAVFAGFLAPYDYSAQSRFEPSAPATRIHFNGLTPIIYPRRVEDPLRRTYTEDTSVAFPVAFFVHGYSYKLLGIGETNVHLFGV